MTKTLTVKEVAEKLETTPRTLRKFLRSDAKKNGTTESLPGKGGRYSFEAREVKSIQKKFNAWVEANAKPEPEDDADETTEDES